MDDKLILKNNLKEFKIELQNNIQFGQQSFISWSLPSEVGKPSYSLNEFPGNSNYLFGSGKTN